MSHSEVTTPPVEAESPVVPERSHLLRWLIGAGMIVVLGGGLMSLLKYAPTEGPEIGGQRRFPIISKPQGPPGKVSLSEDAVHKFGIMAQQLTGSHTWILSNVGEGDLILSKGESTCSCTIANFKDKQTSFTLGPGKSTEITLTWETRAFEGAYKKSADINILNDPNRQVVRLEVTGTVRPAIAIEPKEKVLTLGTIESTENATAKFAIASADRPDLKIVSLTSSAPNDIELEAVPLPDSDRSALEWTTMPGGFLVNVKVKPSKELGIFNEDILVTTDHPQLKEVKLVVAGKRVGPISTIPESVVMHNLDSDAGGKTTSMIMVRNAPDTKLEVVDHPKSLKVEIIPADVKTGAAAKVRQYRLVVTVPPGTPSEVIEGQITIKTDHPFASQVRIPVDITILESK